jgi:hypothetical protein
MRRLNNGIDGLYHISHLPAIIMIYFCDCYKTIEHAFNIILCFCLICLDISNAYNSLNISLQDLFRDRNV